MDLRQFISETITDVLHGIADAQREVLASNLKAEVCPSTSRRGETPPGGTVLEFDIAVTVEQSSQAEKGGGIKVSVVSLGGSTGRAEAATSVSRIKFDLPLQLPYYRREDGRGD